MTRRSRGDELVGTTLYDFGKVSSKTLGEVLEKDVMTYGEMMGQIWKFIHQEELTVEQNTSTNE